MSTCDEELGACMKELATLYNIIGERQLRAFLDLRMRADPWPGGDINIIDKCLDDLSRTFGFTDWIDAYHRLSA